MLEPVFTGKYRSKLTTTMDIFYSELLPYQLLDKACLQYASTKEGRVKAVREMFKFDKKTPFLIAPYELGAFPIMSSKNPECVWIFNHPFDIQEIEKGLSKIIFSGGITCLVACSKHILLKQQQRLHTLLNTYRQIHALSLNS